MNLTKNFKLEEFACHDGTPVPEQYLGNVQIMANNLQKIRDSIQSDYGFDLPIVIVSGYRTPAHNKECGGEKNSFHMKAIAADIKVKLFKPLELRNIIDHLIEKGIIAQGGLGLYDDWVHYDVRQWKARWDKTTAK